MSPIEEKKPAKNTVQNIVVENRERLKITGVIDVESFNEDLIVALTELGRLNIKGLKLKVTKLNIENAELCIEGFVNILEYAEKKNRKKIDKTTIGRRFNV